jgi:hypothetical protein
VTLCEELENMTCYPSNFYFLKIIYYSLRKTDMFTGSPVDFELGIAPYWRLGRKENLSSVGEFEVHSADSSTGCPRRTYNEPESPWTHRSAEGAG